MKHITIINCISVIFLLITILVDINAKALRPIEKHKRETAKPIHRPVYKRGTTASLVTTKKCQCNCPLNNPVCARIEKGKLETFPSECALECYKCTYDKNYTVFRRGPCPAASSSTNRPTPTFQPFTRKASTTRRPSPTPKCKCDCTPTKALCAQDKYGSKETFFSECQLECYNCTHNEDYRKIYDGDCK